jgi:peroxiredoxin
MRKLFYLLLLSGVVAPESYAQKHTRVVSGLVTSQEDAAPLEGVRVAVKGPGSLSGTQPDGMYYIEVGDTDSVLVFSFSEFQTQEVRLTKACEYNVALRKGGVQAAVRPETAVEAGAAARGKAARPFSAVGDWRAVFQLRPGIEVPVNFDIRIVEGGGKKAFFHNAEERFEGGRVEQTADSLFIFLDQFDNELAFRIDNTALEGVLKRQDGSGTALPVKVEAGNVRFATSGAKAAGNFSGTYDVVFIAADGKEERTVGLFEQDGNKLRGTFLRVTGDSRYLEGVVEGNDFYLSGFIGSAPAYYKGSFTADGQLRGEIVGARGSQAFAGVRNEKAALPDAYTLTYLREGYTSFDFSFPDADGRPVSLHDKKFAGKVVIVTIGGTWCPNCVDETAFLAPWYAANRTRGIEVISIQYERQTDAAFVKKVLSRQRERYHIQYDQVFGGLADKQGVARSLPALNAFLAFPTTILVDRKGKVAQIHTGYSGPATGQYYEQSIKEFNKEVDALLVN